MKFGCLSSAILVLELSAAIVSGQSADDLGLTLTTRGRVEGCGEVKAILEVKPKAEKQCRRVRMAFHNKGNEPIIILNPNLGYGTGLKEARFYFEYPDIDPTTFRFFTNTAESLVSIEPVEGAKENFRSMAQMFAGDRPPENMTVILQPGESLEFIENFEAPPQYKDTAAAAYEVIKNGKSVKIEIPSHRESPKHFRLTYEFSFLPYVDDPDLLEKMSIKWRRFGRLPVGINGGYTITSEPIK